MKGSHFSSMLRRSRSRSAGTRRARLEMLEPRRVLAATAVFDAETGVLTVEGDKNDDVIEVRYVNDEIIVTSDDDGAGGADPIDITPDNLPDDLSEVVAILVEGGKGNDEITIEVDGLTIAAGQSLEVEAEGGKGEDTISVEVSQVVLEAANEDLPGGSLSVEADGGKHDDSVDIAVTTLTVNDGAEAEFKVKGGPGDDDISVAVSDLSSDGEVSVEIEGGPGDDTIDATAIDEGVSLEIEGGPGDDTIDAGENAECPRSV